MPRLVDLPTNHPVGFRLGWKIVGSLVAVVALLFGTAQLVTALAHEEETIVTVFDEPAIDTLDIDSDSGSVEIIGRERDSISVTAEVSDGLSATEHSARVDGDRLLLRSSCPNFFSHFCRVSYTVEVPRELDVVVQVDNGSLTIRDLDGTVQASADNGDIDLEGLAGSIDVDSDNGSVSAIGLRSARVEARSDNGSVRLQWDEAPDTVVADSDNGRVELVVPDTGVRYRVDLTSSNGSVETLVNTDIRSDRTLTAHSDNGGVIARYPD